MGHAITLYPAWAWAIFNLDKNIENRSWSLPKSCSNTRVAIHAGLVNAGVDQMVETARAAGWTTIEDGDLIMFRKNGVIKIFDKAKVDRGKIIGMVTFTEVPLKPRAWGFAGKKHWLIRDPELLLKPIRAKGKLRFWTM